MSQILRNLLSMGAHARDYGCGLNPRLRNAIEADLRFPSRAAGPRPTEAEVQAAFVKGAVCLIPPAALKERKQA